MMTASGNRQHNDAASAETRLTSAGLRSGTLIASSSHGGGTHIIDDRERVFCIHTPSFLIFVGRREKVHAIQGEGCSDGRPESLCCVVLASVAGLARHEHGTA
jgi:hypothetical protein